MARQEALPLTATTADPASFTGTTFGALIRARRQRLGLTQAQLATALGVSQPRVQQLESGTACFLPRPGALRALAQALEVPLAALLGAAGYELHGEEAATV